MFEETGIWQDTDELSAEQRELFERLLAKEEIGLETVETVEPIPRRQETGESPLSFGQQRLWLLHQIDPASPAYNVPSVLRMNGRLDRRALAASLDDIVRRHESVRTTFRTVSGRPVQIVDPEARFELPVIDLGGLAPERRGLETAALTREEARRPFDLAVAPLLRGLLVALAPEEHLLLFTMHHIASDGWSTGVLVRELGAFYEARRAGRRPPLPPLPIQYADFAVWQRQWLAGEVLEGQLGYWRGQLAGLPAALDLPTDRPRPAVRRERGAVERFTLSAELLQGLKGLAGNEDATLFMTLLAGFAALLRRYTGQEDLAVGTPIAGRNRVETEGLIGFFVNTLVLRADLSGAPSFLELLRRVRDVSLEAYAHQDLPFELLVEELEPVRDASRTPLFQAMLALQNAPLGALELGGLRLEVLEIPSGTSKFDLELALIEKAGALTGLIEYDTDLFDRSTVARLAGHFGILLSGALAAPEKAASRLPLLAAAERHQLLAEYNDTVVRFPEEGCLGERFERQAALSPDAVAVLWEEEALTYAGLDARAGQLARQLLGAGTAREELVAVWAERGPDLLAAMLGIWRAGAAYLPVDPDHPAQRTAEALEQSGCRLILAGGRFLEIARAEAARLPWSPRVLSLAGPPSGTGGEALPLPRRPLPAELAYVIFTSGSTGRPKGAMVEHRGMLNHLWIKVEDLGLSAADRVAQTASQTFDISVWQFLAALLAGGGVRVLPGAVVRDPELLLAEVEEREITVLEIVPSLMDALLASPRAGRRSSLRPLRWMIPTGEALPPELCRRWFERYPGIPLVNAYGPTECSDDVTHQPLRAPLPEGTAQTPIGRPVGNTSIYLLSRDLDPVPLGVAGELCVAGVQVGRGYLGRPDLTAERFVPDPVSGLPGERLYRTGDLARQRASGAVEFLGRIDHQVKVRGFRIELGEIEAVLAAHPGVQAAVVVAADGAAGQKRLVAYWVPAGEGAGPDLRSALRDRLPEYMVPESFVRLAALPLTPNGKVDRKALPAPEWQDAGESYLAPRTPVEEILAAIWAELLGLDRVGATDHFFHLGGHSLLATQVASRLRGTFGVEMPLRDLFEAPVLADLAARVEAGRRSGAVPPAPPLVRVPREGPLPLSFAQQRLWFVDQLEPGSALYNVPVALRFEGPLSPAVLAGSLGEVVRRHETLRTVFTVLEGSPVQVIRPAASLELPLVDLSGLPESDRETATLALTADEAGRPFDLTRGPLLRGLLLRLAGEEHVVALTLHHIVSDGWSLGILVREVTALYAALSEGRPSPLAELPVQYADFAVWQRSWLDGAALESEVSYWRAQLAGLPPLLELPTDRPRPAVQSYGGASRPLRLSAGLTRQARALGLREGATLFMVLLATFHALLARCSGQKDFAVGTLVAGRHRTEIEGLIGFFLNTLALRADLTGAPSFRGLVVQARETALAAHLHQNVPFEKLVEELTPERSLAHTPLFQVMLVLQNTPAGSLEIRDLRLHPMGDGRRTEPFDLSLMLVEERGGLDGVLRYATDLFDAPTVDRLVLHYERLLTAALEAPDAAVADLALLSASERHQLLAEWNDTAVPLPPGDLLPELFAAQAARTPEALAVTSGGESLTYAQLGARARRLASHLRALGCGPESRVGVAMERTLDLLVALLGVLEAGAVYVPLDPDYPRERLAYLLEDSRPAALLTQESLRERLPLSAGLPVLIPAALPETDGAAGPSAPCGLGGDLLAYIIYTSGSTGRPKGAMVTHRGMINHLWAKVMDLGLGPGCRVAQTASQCFDISVWQLLAPLLVGGSVHIADEPTVRDPELLLRFTARERITVLEVVPSLLSSMLDPLAAGGATDLSRLEWLLVTGEACPPDLADRWLALAPHTRLLNAYGPTECADDVTHYERVGPGSGASLSLPIGRPVANTRIYVLDPGGWPAAQGIPGELCVAGRGVGRGYLGLPARTAQVFVPDAWSGETGGRLYRTGDLARWRTDGTLEFLGRLDHQVKVRGFRIELGEIESALVALPGVREAIVMAREDRSDRGPGDQRLVAYVAGDAAADALRQALRERLPEYMVPAAFVMLAAFPLTPNGKVDRKALPVPERRDAGESYLAPRTPVEEVLAGIWAELLGVERVGADDHFFDLGGHSLLATRVMSRLRGAFGVEMPLRDLFEAPTLAGLAARIETARGTGTGRLSPPLVPAAPALRGGPLPLSFAQQRLWFIDQLEPGSPLYNLPVALRARGRLDAGVLALTLGEIVRRHEALRTVFTTRGDVPVQVIQPAAPFRLTVVDLSGLPEGTRETVSLTLASEEARRPFDLGRGPLLRGVLLRLAEEEHIPLLTLHHIASDAWSMGILIREVVALYAAFAESRPSPLPELPVQYADFAVWQQGWLDQEVLGRLVEHWRRRLAGAPPQLDLPGARPRPAALSPRGAARERRFAPALVERLRALARRESATLFMTLLAPLQALLHARTGATDLVVGTDVAGRDRRETEGLIGFFINQLPLRADLTGNPTLRELLGRVRETALEAYAHQELPFDRLVEALRVEQSLQRSPVFQVKLVLQNVPREDLALPGLAFEVVPSSLGTAQLDLHWNVVESGDDLWLRLTYSTDLYDEPLVEGLLEEYETWLHAFAERPEARLGDVVTELAQAERARRAERGLELKSKKLDKLRSLSRQAEQVMEVGS